MNVIDTLVIELGLDPTKMNRGQREAVDNLRNFEGEAKRRGSAIERSVGGVETAFAGLQRRMLGVAALMLGGLGIESLISRITKLQVSTANLGQTFGLSSQMLQQWAAAGERFGVAGGAVQQGMVALQQQRFNLMNYGDPSGILSLSWGTRGTKNPLVAQAPNGQMLAPEQLAMNIAKWLQKEGPQGANALMRLGGLPQEFVTFLMKGPEEIKKVLAEAKRLAPTDEEIGRFQKLNESFERASQSAMRLATVIVDTVTPALTKMFDHLSKASEASLRTIDLLKQGRIGDALRNEFGMTPQVKAKEEELARIRDQIKAAEGAQTKLGRQRLPALRAQEEAVLEELRKIREQLEKSGGDATLQKQSFLSPSGENVRVWQASQGGGSQAYPGGGNYGGGVSPGGGASPGGARSGAGSAPMGGRAARGASDAAGGLPNLFDVVPGIGSGTGLAADRARFAEELRNNPALREKVIGIIAGENPHPTAGRAVVESMMNRASMMGTSLAHSARTTREGGYYQGYKPGASGALRERLNSYIDDALRGSNTANYATDNASQGLAAKHKVTGVFEPTGPDLNRETFFRPGTTKLRGGRAAWDRWRARVGSGATDDEVAKRILSQGAEEAVGRAARPHGDQHGPMGGRKPGELFRDDLMGPTRTFAPKTGVDELRTFMDSGRRFAGQVGGKSTSSSVTMGNVHIHTQATDAKGIAADMQSAVQRFGRVASANNGPA